MQIKNHAVLYTVTVFVTEILVSSYVLLHSNPLHKQPATFVFTTALIFTVLSILGYTLGVRLTISPPVTYRVVLSGLFTVFVTRLWAQDIVTFSNEYSIIGLIILISFLAGWRLSSDNKKKPL